MKRILLKIFLLSTVSLLFLSCSNIFSSDSSSENSQKETTSLEAHKYVTITGTISLPEELTESGALPEDYLFIHNVTNTIQNRSAFPATPTNTDYYVTATATGETTINVTPTETESGATFSITLPVRDTEKSWSIEAGLKASFNGSTAVILKDVCSVTISSTSPTFNHNFVIKPLETGNGNVELTMSFQSSNAADELELYFDNTKITAGTGETISHTNITLKNRPAGAYKAKFVFKKNGYVVYTDYQGINIFPNMTTNTWHHNGGNGSSEPIDYISGKWMYYVTNASIASYMLTQIYVGNTTIGETTITASDETGNGTIFAPYETFEKAIKYLQKNGNTNKDYTIWISGEIAGAQTISDVTNEDSTSVLAKSLTISGVTGSTTDILKGGSSGSVLLVDTTVPVTITNLKITGGKGTSSVVYSNTSKKCGGGLNVKSGTVTLSTDTVITGNNAEYGGGVYVASGAKLFMNDNSVVGNPITNSTTTASAENYTTYSNCANYATAFGGGIYVNGGELYLGYTNGTTPTLDETFTGGVIRNACIRTGNNSGEGGGIYCNGSVFKMSKGKVAYNYSDYFAGGIELSGSATIFDFSGGSIEKNTTVYKGGGGYITDAKVYMSGTALIGDTGTSMTQVSDFSNKVIGTDNTVFSGGLWMDGSSSLYLGFTPPTTEGGEPVADNNFSGGICHNYSSNYAGGFYHGGTLVKINKGNISYNKSENSGGGCYFSGSGSSFTMTGGNFTSNTCGENGHGGAIYYNQGTLALSGGTFTSNTCGSNGNGGAINVNYYYNYQSFTLSGGVSFPDGSAKNNDIYLKASYTITLGTNISGGATITPSTWSRGNQIFSGGTNVTDEVLSKFSLSDSDWSIEKYGSNSNTKGIINADIYVSASGNDSYSGVSSSKAFKTIAAAAKTCKSCKTEIKVVGTFSASSASDLQSIPNSDDITVSSITLTGTGSGATINANSKGSAFTINKAILVNIENITLKGGNSTNGAGLNVAVSGAKVNLGNNVFIKENKASGYGGGVYVASGAKLCLNGSAVIGNSEGDRPANTSVEPSSSNGINKANLGGGIYCEGTLGIGKSVNSSGNLSNSGFTGGIYTNVSTEYGGGIYLTSSSTLSTNGNFNIVKNRAGSGGGGIYYASTGALSLSSGTFTSNVAGAGGAILIPNGNNIAITLSGGSYTSNSTTTGAGGAINSWSTGLLKLEGSVSFSSNTGSTSSGGGALSHNGNYEFKSTDIHILYGGSIGSNDVWLYPGKYIKLEAGLYYHDSNNPIGINATTVNTQVLGGSNLTSSMIEKFVIVDDAYALDSEGYLREAITSVTMDDVTSMEWISDQWGDMTHDGSNFSVNDLSDIEGQVIICKIDRDEVWAALCFSNVTEDGFRLDVKVYDDSHEEPYVYGDDYEYSEVMDKGCCIDLSYGSLSVWADPGDGTSNFYIYDDHSFSTHLGFDTGEVGWLVLD